MIDSLKILNEVEIDWKGKLYCGINLDWHYHARYVNIPMPNYVHNNQHNTSPTHLGDHNKGPTRQNQ